jgi:hypothetical protein
MRDLSEKIRRKVRFKQILANLFYEKQTLRVRGFNVYDINRKPLNKGLRKGD